MASSKPTYKPGDHVKAEFGNENSEEKEWMWVEVDHCDDEKRLVFGRLDSTPVVNTVLKVGQALAVSYDKIRDHQSF